MTYHRLHKPKFIKFYITMKKTKGKLYQENINNYLKDEEDY